MPRQVRLSSFQQAVVARMRQGWELRGRLGFCAHYCLRRGEERETVSAATMRVLLTHDVIEEAAREYPRCRYQLRDHIEEMTP